MFWRKLNLSPQPLTVARISTVAHEAHFFPSTRDTLKLTMDLVLGILHAWPGTGQIDMSRMRAGDSTLPYGPALEQQNIYSILLERMFEYVLTLHVQNLDATWISKSLDCLGDSNVGEP